MRRGFKAHAERLALQTRAAIGQGAEASLQIPALRQHLGVSLVTLTALSSRCPEEVAHLHGDGREAFSAALLLGPAGRVIVINDSHSRTRLANSIAHELSHLLLDHPQSPLFDPLGNREWHQDHEDEADWLAGCLLAPRSGLIPVVSRLELDLAQGARHFGISTDLMRQRWHQTGAAAQLQRFRRR